MSYDAILQVSKAEETARANLSEAQNRARERIAAAQSAAEQRPKHWPRNEKGTRPTRPIRRLCPVRTAAVSENGRRPTWMRRLPE